MTTSKKKATAVTKLALPFPASRRYTAILSTVQQQLSIIGANPDLTNHPEVAASVTSVQAQVTKLGTTVTTLGNAHASVSALEAERTQDVVTLRRLHTNLAALLNIASAGNAQAALAWGGKIVTRTLSAVSTDAPGDAIVTNPAPGTVECKCKAEQGVVCYLVQQGSDPTNEQAWAQPVIVGGAKYKVTGLTVGQRLYFRMAIVRRGSGQSQWTNVLEVTVR